jgi:hypothetical protein
MLSLRLLSTLRLILELLLRRRFLRSSAGSCGWRPVARAKRFKISVKLITPVKRPDKLAPGRLDALMPGPDAALVVYGGPVAGGAGDGNNALPEVLSERGFCGGTGFAGVKAGVGGPDEAGEGASTIHILAPISIFM